MSDILNRLTNEADGIRAALNSSGEPMLMAQRLGSAERALRAAIAEIKRLEERKAIFVEANEKCHEQIVALERKLLAKPQLPQSIQEALNSGDGSYKP